MSFYLVEYETGNRFGPASEEAKEQYGAALRRGAAFFLYPYFGYTLKMAVVKDSPGPMATEEDERPVQERQRTV